MTCNGKGPSLILSLFRAVFYIYTCHNIIIINNVYKLSSSDLVHTIGKNKYNWYLIGNSRIINANYVENDLQLIHVVSDFWNICYIIIFVLQANADVYARDITVPKCDPVFIGSFS